VITPSTIPAIFPGERTIFAAGRDRRGASVGHSNVTVLSLVTSAMVVDVTVAVREIMIVFKLVGVFPGVVLVDWQQDEFVVLFFG
jgi:hypothetical protein